MRITEPGTHLDHMVRQTRIHHVQLSFMADMKANILLTMAAVMITICVRYITEPHLKWATIVLIVTCLITIVLATYAVMPKLPITFKPGTSPDAHASGLNLLFFGDFVRFEYDDFEAAMEEMMNDPDLVYEAQVREAYTLGMFLAKKKYRFVRLAYVSFIAGLLTSGLMFIFYEAFIQPAPWP